ncbi:Release factor glutamine methyltransferase [Candidatus Clavichlamydia salmonicola]|uniref:peptide chain release factor N(5)-glutamine methyltransferase n=1 Tax=Candidatus Clavichlamydia salmonicola TaxID=469812 RepID=UPI0018912FEE|nr:peptide chain release factor N(5)-glutamine methyltransferase [Candidatus Clavichlamydia salmonicola]MBF5050843.1 Release factor glutamine methyltransferase [Candidatus Clavichlamydia salmonicola]
MITYSDLLKKGIAILTEKNVPFSERDARLLLTGLLKCSLSNFSFHIQFQEADQSIIDQYEQQIIRRGNREPLSYIEGEINFYGVKILLSPAVLIPRQETEIFIEKFCNAIVASSKKEPIIWDLCCGSGCIGIAVKKKLPHTKVSISDICSKAILIAHQNVKINNVDVEIFEGDLFAPFQGRSCDFIICNPPYITEKDWCNLMPEVRDYEPKKALVGKGLDGLGFYAKIANSFSSYLMDDGELWLEIGSKQGEGVKKIFSRKKYFGQIFKDWSGNDRFFSLNMIKN